MLQWILLNYSKWNWLSEWVGTEIDWRAIYYTWNIWNILWSNANRKLQTQTLYVEFMKLFSIQCVLLKKKVENRHISLAVETGVWRCTPWCMMFIGFVGLDWNFFLDDSMIHKKFPLLKRLHERFDCLAHTHTEFRLVGR